MSVAYRDACMTIVLSSRTSSTNLAITSTFLGPARLAKRLPLAGGNPAFALPQREDLIIKLWTLQQTLEGADFPQEKDSARLKVRFGRCSLHPHHGRFSPSLFSISSRLLSRSSSLVANFPLIQWCAQRATALTDTAGQDEYSILNGKHFIGIHGYMLVYSVSSLASFEMVHGPGLTSSSTKGSSCATVV
ncbi:hypothetical protein B0T20DRAFT_2417 [Sordaria brevicollis]|uniref:Uncharacterized protein n=1 Tax=Sordaria brevicollis TaxID=83679 RepID=A0AAE0PM61_SORBR|nr:hypothetical protein B0T20DRAFT_2417 [Sordaria brevicollis]